MLETDDGELIPESGAILLYLAEGTALLPAGGRERVRVHQWMFFEQNRIEADLAVARFMKFGAATDAAEAFGQRLERGSDVWRRSTAGSPMAGRSWRATPTRSPTSPSTATRTVAPTPAPTRARTRTSRHGSTASRRRRGS